MAPTATHIALPIETERLLLRGYEPGDLENLARMQSDPELVRWIPWGPRSLDEVKTSLARKIAARALEAGSDGLGMVAELKADGTFVGDFTLHRYDDEHSCAEIGFMMLTDHHGRGYATEACRGILATAFEVAGLHRVIGRVEPRNSASCRVMERVGMRREAHLIENEWIKGEWQSECTYAILAREWMASA